MVAWGPIIGAGISAIGSLFGGGDDEETTTTVDYGAMAKAAEKAGFNPLTAIRNGGSAGFTTTHHPGLSGMDRFGAAFQTLGNALMSFDARADERAELENKLLTVQLDRLQRTPLEGQRFSMAVPQAAGSTTSTKAATGGAGAGLAADPGVNLLVNFPGGVSKPAFEPVTEYDELAVGVDQATSDIKRVWAKDPFKKWLDETLPVLLAPKVTPWKPLPKWSTQPRRPISWTPGVNRHALGG